MKYRKKSATVNAMQWNGDNADAIAQWAQGGWRGRTELDGANGGIWIKQLIVDEKRDLATWRLVIPTDDGDVDAEPGDWIVSNADGNLSVFSPDAFKSAYEPI